MYLFAINRQTKLERPELSESQKRENTKIKNENLYAYNVYQIEGEGRSLFSKIEGDEDTIMGLPVKQIKEYLNTIE